MFFVLIWTIVHHGKSKKLWRSKIVTNVICHPSRSYIGVPEFSAFPSAKFLMDAKIIQPCAEGHLLSLQFLVTNYIFFLNKIMYSHFIFTRKNTSTLYLNFFFVKMKLLTFFRAYIGNKTNCDGPTAAPPHHIWKLSVSIFLSFWPTSNVLKFVFSRKIVAHFCVAWKNLNFIHLLLIFTVWVSIVK